MTISWPDVIVTIVTFILVLIILGKTAWKPILAGLQKREDTIRKAVDDAEEASRRAQEMIAEYEAKLATATDEARAIAEEAKKDGEDVRRRIEEEANKQAAQISDRAKREIEQAKVKAYDELVQDVAVIAAEAASRIVSANLTPEDNAEIVSQVVSDFTEGAGTSGGGRL